MLTAIMNGDACSSTLVTPVISEGQHQQRHGARPVLAPHQRLEVQRAGAQQPELLALERHRREHESRGDGGEHEPGERQVEEHHHRDQQHRHALAGEERQRADVEDVDQQEHGEQDQLAPLRGIAEEQQHVLDDELPLGHRQADPSSRGGDPGPVLAAHVLLGAFLGLGEPVPVEPLVRQRAQHDERARGAPQQHDRQRIGHPIEPVHDDVRRPLGRQERAGRALQRAQEVDQVAEALGPRQPLGLQHAQRHHHDRHRADGHEAQQVARAPGGEDVHQHQGDHRPDDGRQQQERHEGAQRHEPEPGTAVVDDAVGREDRDGQQRHHPRRVRHRLAELREVEPEPVDRRRDEHVEVLRQEERRERRDEVGQQQDRREREQDHAQHLLRAGSCRSPARSGRSAAPGTPR